MPFIGFIIAVDDKYYFLLTDNEVDTIVTVKEFDELSKAENYLGWGNDKEDMQEELQ